MQRYKVLVLTDHTNHSKENSLYTLARAMRVHPLCLEADVATRADSRNDDFFKNYTSNQLWVSSIDDDFAFSEDGVAFYENARLEYMDNYDLVWLRMPPPLPKAFLKFLADEFSSQFIINHPKSIYETGSKGFLMNFKEVCPPMQLCLSVEDIIQFKNQFPIVLKPFREYGGKGIVRIDGNTVWDGKEKMDFESFVDKIRDQKIEYLGVKFLKNVSKGDKRIVVVNGKIMGASLRLPAKDSWLCNVAMGGTSSFATVDEDELKIVECINPTLSKMGIVMYGVDTLVGDDGKRILSEINTTSIGGLPQIARMMQQPLVEEAIDLIWSYFLNKNSVRSI